MPIYAFRCKHCREDFEKHRTVHNRNKPTRCPICKHTASRVIHPSAIRFDGEGFYKTDSLKKKDKKRREE